MTRPARLCTCGQIVPHAVVCTCQIAAKRERDRRHDARRPSSHASGYTAEWRRKSREWLDHHPDCVMCGRPGNLVDHIVPHHGDQSLFGAGAIGKAYVHPVIVVISSDMKATSNLFEADYVVVGDS